MKNAFLVTLGTLLIMGGGCVTGESRELGQLKQENDDIGSMALTDVECGAWLEDESIAVSTDRKVFTDLCYFSKAIEHKDARYCLSASAATKNDCVEMIAVKFDQPENCLNYLPDTLGTFQDTCILKVAAVNKSLDVCQNVSSDFAARCGELVEQCTTNPEASVNCSPEVPQTISCDYLYEKADRSRCETEFYETFISL